MRGPAKDGVGEGEEPSEVWREEGRCAGLGGLTVNLTIIASRTVIFHKESCRRLLHQTFAKRWRILRNVRCVFFSPLHALFCIPVAGRFSRQRR